MQVFPPLPGWALQAEQAIERSASEQESRTLVVEVGRLVREELATIRTERAVQLSPL